MSDAEADAAQLYEALLRVPYHANPRLPPGHPYGYPPEGHREYSCRVCIALDRHEERLRLGVYGEADAAIARAAEDAA